MTVSLVVSLLAAFALCGAEAAFLVNYLRRRSELPTTAVPYRGQPALDVIWAVCPAVFVAILIALTLQAGGAFNIDPTPLSAQLTLAMGAAR